MKRRHFLRHGLWIAGSLCAPHVVTSAQSLAFFAAAEKQGHPPTAAPGGDVTDGLIGSWPLDEGTGTTSADDSATGADASFVGTPAWTTGKSGGALTFSTGNYLSAGTNAAYDIARPLTLICWMNPTAIDFERYAIFKNGRFGIRITDSGCAQFAIPGQASATADTNQMTGGNWYFIATVVSAGDNKCHYYFNGSAASEPSFNADGTGTGADLLIGSNSATGYNGKLDSIRVYNRALSATEIGQVYTATGGT